MSKSGNSNQKPPLQLPLIAYAVIFGIIVCSGIAALAVQPGLSSMPPSSTMAAAEHAFFARHSSGRESSRNSQTQNQSVGTVTSNPVSISAPTPTPTSTASPAPATQTASTSVTVAPKSITVTSTVATTSSSSSALKSQTSISIVATTVATPTATTIQNSQYGISVGVTPLGLSQSQLDAEFADMQSMGIGWVRMDFDWKLIQPDTATSYNWSGYDAVVASAKAHNIRILGILGYTPSWARFSGCGSEACPPASDSQFATYVNAVVSRYASQGVHTWEIWNEPNNAGFWVPVSDVTAYVQLLKTAYPTVKQVDPSAVVISGGLAPESTNSGNISPNDFLSLMYALGGKNYFDAVGIHPYSFPAMPGYFASWNAWSQMSQTSQSLRSIMVANGDSGKQIWMTEYGAPTGGPGVLESSASDTVFTGGPDHVTEALQAQMIAQAVQLKNSYSWAGPLFFYSYKDLGTSQSTVENWFGFLRFDGSQKPSYSILKSLIGQ